MTSMFPIYGSLNIKGMSKHTMLNLHGGVTKITEKNNSILNFFCIYLTLKHHYRRFGAI